MDPKVRLPFQRTRTVLRLLASFGFIAAGANHFLNRAFYERLIPPRFPGPAILVIVSGICEIAGGVGLLVPKLRKAASWGLVTLLIAVFPANLYMAKSPERFSDLHIPYSLIVARLPFQAVLMMWVWWCGSDGRGNSDDLSLR